MAGGTGEALFLVYLRLIDGAPTLPRSPFSRLYLPIYSRAPIASVPALENRVFSFCETQLNELVPGHLCSVAAEGYTSERLNHGYTKRSV